MQTKPAACGKRLLALVLGFGLETLGIGELVAEAFQCLGDGAGFIGAVLTLLGNLIADVSYAVADPRIRVS